MTLRYYVSLVSQTEKPLFNNLVKNIRQIFLFAARIVLDRDSFSPMRMH